MIHDMPQLGHLAMRHLIAVSALSLALASGAHGESSWFRLGIGSSVALDDSTPPTAGTNDNIEVAVDTTPRARVYGDLELPVVVSGVDSTYSIEVAGLPAGAGWTPDGSSYGTGSISWPSASAGVYPLTVRVLDASGDTVATKDIAITILPELTASVAQTSYSAVIGDVLEIQASAQNAIGSILWGSSSTALPSWLHLDAGTGLIEVDTSTANGFDDIVLAAVDQADAAVASTSPFSVTVSDSCDVWSPAVAPEANSWNSVAYGNGLFVAVASSGTNLVMTSPDGVAWTARAAAEANDWNSVTYGNGKFVAVAQSGTHRVMTSPDGIVWTARTAGEDGAWQSVTYGNGKFVAVASEGTHRVMTSPDGITWTTRTAAENQDWTSVTYGNGKFVAVTFRNEAGTHHVMTSSDGITWTARTAPEGGGWRSVVYGAGTFVAVGNGTHYVMTSPDGTTWTPRPAAEDHPWQAVAYGNGLFVAVTWKNYAHRVMTSPDGIAWTARNSSGAELWQDIGFGNGRFVALAYGANDQLLTSDCH